MNKELMAQLMGLSGGGMSREDLIQQMLASHPQGEMLARLMSRNGSEASEAQDADELWLPDLELDDLLAAPRSESPVSGDANGSEARLLTAQVHALTERCAVLAAGLGACGCFGELVDCPECQGQGVSGWRRPDREAFDTFVAPLFRRMEAARAAAKKAAKSTPPAAPLRNAAATKQKGRTR